MGTNFERFLYVLSKWPNELNKNTLDYGNHLRQLIKLKDVNGNVFPGSMAENSKKLDALLRLVNDTYRNKYSYSANLKEPTIDLKEIEDLLNTHVKKTPNF